MLNFSFSEKGLGLVSPSLFVYDFPQKMLHSINWPLSGCPYFSRYLVICALWLFISQVVTSWNLKLIWSSLSSRFTTWPKSQGKNLNILRTKRSFEVKCKAFFIIFQGLSVAKNYLRPESTYLSQDVSRSNEIP